jgi:hypothetical protein
MDHRLQVIDTLVPKKLLHRVTIIDMLYILTASGTPVAIEDIPAFLWDMAQTDKKTVGQLFQALSDEIEDNCREGMSVEKQFHRFVEKINI